MRLRHYAPAVVTLDRDAVYEQGGLDRPLGKPNGLWLSVEDDPVDGWFAAVEDMGLAPERVAVEHVVDLHPDANLLVVKDAEDLERLDAMLPALPLYPGDDATLRVHVDWSHVIEEFDGVVIAPYRYERRLDSAYGWYYGWDCASGCVWNLDAIAALTPIVEG